MLKNVHCVIILIAIWSSGHIDIACGMNWIKITLEEDSSVTAHFNHSNFNVQH